MSMRTREQAVQTNEQAHGPAPSRLASDNAGAQNHTARNESAREPVSSEQASTEQQGDHTTAPNGRPSDSGPSPLFPHLAWTQPGASLAGTSSTPTPARRQRIPYIHPADMADGVPVGLEDDLAVSSAFGFEGMPGILMYAPERSLLAPAAGSVDTAPDHMVLCVVEDAFEHEWVAPQGYWNSVFK